MSEGFFQRWSRRKQDARGLGAASPAPASPSAAAAGPAAVPVTAPVVADAGAIPAETPPLTLADAQALTLQSDFRPFLAPGVAPPVRNAAMRQLFADPHFNVMDGLDTYIDDYSRPDPLPAAMLRQLASAQFLQPPEGAVADDVTAPRVRAEPGPAGSMAECPQEVPADREAAAAGPDAVRSKDDHANPDLQLQPDDSAGRAGPGPCAR